MGNLKLFTHEGSGPSPRLPDGQALVPIAIGRGWGEVAKRLLLTGYIVMALLLQSFSQITWSPNHSVGILNNIYSYGYNQTPGQLVELNPPANPNTGFTYSWESCPSPIFASPFTVTTVGTASSYSPPALTASSQTTYYRRKTTYTANGTFIYSNIVKIAVVSVNWEDINYVREHDILTTGITTWTAADQLAIGQKLQTTTYLDGLGRSIEKISRETATPSSGTLWGDIVQFSEYDEMGREIKKYLPYTTTNQSGKYKTTTITDQAGYYSAAYTETSPYSQLTFESNPLNRVSNVKEPGQSWAASAGNTVTYDVNTAADNVQIWGVDYIQGNPPVNHGPYPPNTLYKLTYTDVNGKKVVEFTDKAGRLILKAVQLANDVSNIPPSGGGGAWICTYSVYDDFGLLRYQIQPEGVKWLDNNSWNFAAANGSTVLAEQVFQYNYDDKGRTIWKKAPGAAALNMLYDARDRVVFMQDGNQAALPTPQWTVNLYDELDRPTITALYNTTKSIATLQSDINNAAAATIFPIVNPLQPVANLILNKRETTSPPNRYAATSSIEFISNDDGSFESNTNDEFVAEIDPAATQLQAVTAVTYKNPVSNADLTNASVCTILKYLFYDDYSFTNAKPFITGFTNTDAYSTSDPNVLPIANSKRTLSLPTGSLTRVLGGNLFLTSTQYYDEKGHPIQAIEDNIKSGYDVTTLQYHFDDRVLSTCREHSTNGTGYSNFKTLTKYIFDKIGRVTSIQKTYGSNAARTIAGYDYDDMGRVKTKHLDPGYSNNPTTGLNELESLNYSFNIHNQITGINKDYALKTPLYNKWGHYFGMYLGYDNKDNVFTKAELNGQVTGILWNSMGDDAQRKYDYRYDNAGRLTKADYTEKLHPGDGWANNKMDFSVNGYTGQVTYDLNGNLQSMLQKGVMPGTATPITVDDLRYIYATLSNKLQSVSDMMTTTNLNGMFGDIKDGSNGSNPDYVYDNNGNVVIDLNKNAKDLTGTGTNGIKYNYLDKPELIKIVGKGTVRIVYSADGEKLQRTFIPEAGGASTITTYINEFVYTETATVTTSTPAPLGGTPTLAYINFEEGRIRIMTPVSQDNGLEILTVAGNLVLPNSKAGAFDYFVMDYQQNVRMILTEEVHVAGNTATMELTNNRPAAEEPVFGQTGAANEVSSTRYDKPSAWTGNSSSKVSRLGNLAGKNVGPNTLQKVMAGDRISARVDYYYQSATGGDNPNIVATVLSSLMQAVTGGTAAGPLVKAGATGINSTLNGLPGFTSAVKPTGSGGNTPQAYLTMLFFDERFNLVDASDGGLAQSQVASSVTASGLQLSQVNIKAPCNGYVYAYLSNRSDQDVYFDNFKVTINTGNIIEENHYYSYGLKIAAISSRKLPDANEGVIKNNNLYNDKELWDDGDLNWYDYGFRNYDPQIGRFTQLDPLTDDYPFMSPYLYGGNDPIANIDFMGMGPETGLTAATAKALGEVVVHATKPAMQTAARGVSIGAKTYTKASLAIKISIMTKQVGSMRSESTCQGCNQVRIDPSRIAPEPKTLNEITGKNLYDFDADDQEILLGKETDNPIERMINNEKRDDLLKGEQTFKLTAREKLYIAGHLAIFTLPTSKLASSATKEKQIFETSTKEGEIFIEKSVGAAPKGFTRNIWKLTDEGASKIANHKTWGKFYKSATDGTWWAADKYGHGGSAFKVFRETKKGLEWIQDANKYGDYIFGKHKGTTGAFIPWNELNIIR